MLLEFLAHAKSRIFNDKDEGRSRLITGTLLTGDCDRAAGAIVFDSISCEIEKNLAQVKRASDQVVMLDKVIVCLQNQTVFESLRADDCRNVMGDIVEEERNLLDRKSVV